MPKRSVAEVDRYITRHHTTLPWRPTARIVLATAERDLQTHRDNQRIKRQRAAAKRDGAPASAQGKTARTTFLVKHLTNASKASEVLRAAISDIEAGRRARSTETQLIYDSAEVLRQALFLSEGGGRQPHGAVQAQAKRYRPPAAPRLF